MRAHVLRALRSSIRRLTNEARLIDKSPEWEGVKESIDSALAMLNGAALYIETRIPDIDRSAQARHKERAVLAAVKLGAKSPPAVEKATGLAKHDVANAILRLREQGLLSKADWQRSGLRLA